MPKGISISQQGIGEKRLVFIHGLCGTKEIWRAQLNHFAPVHEVIAMDLLGHGRSESVRPENLVSESARRIHDWLIQQPAKETILIGHSLGGWVAHALAQMGAVDALIFIDSPCLYDAQVIAGYHDWGKQILAAPEPREFVRQWFEGFLSTEADSSIRAEIVDEAVKFDPEWLATIMQTASAPSRPSWAASVVVMEGEQYFAPGNALSWLEYYPHSRQSYFPGARHFFFREDPDAFNRELARLI